MAALKIVSVALLVLGIVILVVLNTLGGVIKKTLDDTIYDRLEYNFPKSREQCYRSLDPKFYDEYYLWNMTNPNEFLQGAKPHFNLTGPYSYTQWYCHFDHVLNKETGYLSYRTEYEGYRFVKGPSDPGDDVKITNINPGYLGILRQVNDGQLPMLAAGKAIEGLIKQMRDPQLIALVQAMGLPEQLYGTNNLFTKQELPKSAANIMLAELASAQNFFNDSFNGATIQSYASWVNTTRNGYNDTIASATKEVIFQDFTNPTLFGVVSNDTVAGLTVRYSLTAPDADYLAAYIEYLFTSPSVVGSAMEAVYATWANGGTYNSNAVWSINGIPSIAGVSVADANRLFSPLLTDATSCSLTSPVGIRKWINIFVSYQKNPNDTAALITSIFTNCTTFTLTPTQAGGVATWIQRYIIAAVSPYLLQKYQIANWDDFAYAQWGGRVIGSSIQAIVPGLTFAPELAPYLTFSPSVAKEFLNGTNGIFNSANWQRLLTMASSGNFTGVWALYPMLRDPPGSPLPGLTVGYFLAEQLGYVPKVVVQYITYPFIKNLTVSGSGLITTRTAREWLMTARDELVESLLGPESAGVALVGNLTRSRKEAIDRNITTYYRVYTGDNDLHWALMPWNNGTNVTYWNGTMLITGYNGTQFLPNGYLDDPKQFEKYPLTLWHRMINRTIPFKVVGKDKWEGVNVRYLTMTDDALLSADKNPVNALYYAKYSGVIDKTTNPPYLPAFLTTPNFLSAEPAFSANVSTTDEIWMPSYDGDTNPFSTHRYSLFLLAEPKLGSTLWGNLPIQVNFKFGPTAFFPNIPSGFAPIYWNAIGDKATSKNLDTIKDSLYFGDTAWRALVGVGVGVGVPMIIGGIVGLIVYRKQKGIKVDA